MLKQTAVASPPTGEEDFAQPGAATLHLFRLVVVPVCALLVALLAGCSTAEVYAARGLHAPDAQPMVLILPLYENPDEYGASDYTLFGRTGSQGSGLVVSRAVALSLKNHLSVVSPEAIRLAMLQRGLQVADLAALADAAALELARELKADMLVLGQIETCRTTWFLFVPRSRVAFNLRAMYAQDGRSWWNARFEDASFSATERELAADGARRIIRLLNAKRIWLSRNATH